MHAFDPALSQTIELTLKACDDEGDFIVDHPSVT